MKLNILQTLLIIPILVIGCTSKKYIIWNNNTNPSSPDLRLKDELIIESDENFDDLPLSDIRLKEIEDAKINLSADIRKDYYIKLLGKKVKWKGEVEDIYRSKDGFSEYTMEINPPAG